MGMNGYDKMLARHIQEVLSELPDGEDWEMEGGEGHESWEWQNQQTVHDTITLYESEQNDPMDPEAIELVIDLRLGPAITYYIEYGDFGVYWSSKVMRLPMTTIISRRKNEGYEKQLQDRGIPTPPDNSEQLISFEDFKAFVGDTITKAFS